MLPTSPYIYLAFLAGLAIVDVVWRRAQNARRAPQDAEAMPYAALLDASYGWECWLGPDGAPRWISQALVRITGYTLDECMAMPDFPLPLVHQDDRERVSRLLADSREGHFGEDQLFRIRRRDNHVAWITASWQTVPEAGGVRFSFQDVTRRKIVDDTLRHSDEQFRLLVDAVKDCAISLVDAHGQVTSWNPGAARIYGYQPYEILGRHISVFHPREQIEAGKITSLLRIAGTASRCEDESWRVRRDGSRFWADEYISPLRDEDDSIRGYAIVTRDTTEQKRIEEELRERNTSLEHLSRQLRAANAELNRLALTDPLTGLLNRRAWEDEAEREQQRSQRSGQPFSLIAVDLDHFKSLNDTLGHQAGDECLRRVAQALENACRASDRVGRMGGEEFMVLAPDTGAAAALDLAERLRMAIFSLEIPNPSSKVAPTVTASFGVSVAKDGALSQTVKAADEALYEAKRSGRNRVCTASAALAAQGA